MQSCKCPPFENRSFDELIEFFGLGGPPQHSKNCCEPAGYICSNLDRALVKARKKRDSLNKTKRGTSDVFSTPKTGTTKHHTKKKLVM